jgi:formate C-acetyltransferase
VGNGCQEVICRNQVHSRAFIYINMAQILLDTLRFDGTDLPENAAYFYRYGDFDKSDFDALYRSFLANLRSYIRVLADVLAPYEQRHHEITPEPMMSAFTADCVAAGKDMSEGGARYNHKTLSFVGFGTLCDSLLSLRKAYGDGTEAHLMDAVARNFEGEEAYRQMLLNSELRFGHSPEGDRFAHDLAGELAQVSRGIRNGRGIEWRTSLFTYYLFKNFGQDTGATPDGRGAYEPLSRQMNMARLPDLTTAAQSMSVLTDADFNDVGMFDIALPVTVTDSEEAHRALTDYIRTCILLKLPVLQTNVADVKTMREEREKKGTHPDMVVRVCGYSAVFGQLPADMQDEIIARAESGV